MGIVWSELEEIENGQSHVTQKMDPIPRLSQVRRSDSAFRWKKVLKDCPNGLLW